MIFIYLIYISRLRDIAYIHVHLGLNSSSGNYCIMKMLKYSIGYLIDREKSENFIEAPISFFALIFTLYGSWVACNSLACIANGYKSSHVDREKSCFFIFIYTYRISHRNQINSRKRFCLPSRNCVETYRVSNV